MGKTLRVGNGCWCESGAGSDSTSGCPGRDSALAGGLTRGGVAALEGGPVGIERGCEAE